MIKISNKTTTNKRGGILHFVILSRKDMKNKKATNLIVDVIKIN